MNSKEDLANIMCLFTGHVWEMFSQEASMIQCRRCKKVRERRREDKIMDTNS